VRDRRHHLGFRNKRDKKIKESRVRHGLWVWVFAAFKLDCLFLHPHAFS